MNLIAKKDVYCYYELSEKVVYFCYAKKKIEK